MKEVNTIREHPTWKWLAVFFSLIGLFFGFEIMLLLMLHGIEEAFLFVIYGIALLGYLVWLRKKGFLGED